MFEVEFNVSTARRIFWKQRTISSWGTQAERRHFFEELAEELGFDPFVASNWYSIPRSPIIQKQVFNPCNASS